MNNTKMIFKAKAALAVLTFASMIFAALPITLHAQITIDNTGSPTITPDTITPGSGGTPTDVGPGTGNEWTWTPVAGDTPPTDTTTPGTIDSYNGSYCLTGQNTNFDKLSDVFKFFTCFLERLLLPLFFAIAGLAFVWGTVKFMMAHDSAEKEQGQQFMLWGIIGFAVMVSLWGLINILGVTFHINNVLPTVPTTTHIQ